MSTGAPSQFNAAYFQAIVPGNAWAVTIGSGATKAQVPFAATTTLIRLAPSSDCHVAFGVNPVAVVPSAGGAVVSNQVICRGGGVYYVGVTPGQYLSVIEDSGAGVLHVTEGS